MKQMLGYVHGNSVIHRLNPLTKLLWAVAACVACFVSSNHLFLLGVLVLTVVIAGVSGVLGRAAGVYKALFILGLFLMLFQLLFTPHGRVYFYILPGVPVTDMGLGFSSLLMLRMMAALSPLSLMLMLTPMNELLTAMTHSLKVPYRYAFAVVTALRFIPAFSQEMDQIMQAQRSRGHETDTRNPIKKIRVIIPMCVPLLISSVRKVETMAISLETRGFCTGPRSCRKKLGFTLFDLLAIILVMAVLSLSVIIG
ncbi:MAG: energy-coupling factor transporter transmembrane protein EcfT [Clostridiaceae bacterium]|nr:energy-coupling factor transporter transmembrane protein EcfT [Clostridiaceae bacterium]